MNKFIGIVSSVCLCALLLSNAPIHAEDAPEKKPAPATRYDDGMVNSVDEKKMTINVQTGKETSHDFTVTGDTRFVKDDKDAKLSDLAKGKYVSIGWVKDGEKMVAKRIKILDQAPPMSSTSYPDGLVTAVDAAAKTIEVQTGKETKKTFAVTDDAKITKGGMPAAKGDPSENMKLADIKAGNYVRLTAVKDDAGKMSTKRITVFEKKPEADAGKSATATGGVKAGAEEKPAPAPATP